MTRASLRQWLGVAAFDLPRILPALLLRADGWTRVRNRAQELDADPTGTGLACRGEWSSDIHACAVLPSLARATYRRALAQWPVSLSATTMPPSSPRMSFVIPHRGRERLPLLLRTIQSILGQRDIEVECIVVEQAPRAEIRPGELPDGVKHILLVHPDEPEAWRKSWAFNRGVAAASADIVVCHDGDILVPDLYSLEILRALGEQGYEVAHLQRFLFCLSGTDTTAFLSDGRIDQAFAPERVRQNWRGGTLAIRKRAYEAIGGFDESFVGWGGEDIEFYDRCRALRQQRFGYLPFVHLWHAPQETKSGESRVANLEYMQAQLEVPRHVRIETLGKRARVEPI